MKPIEKSSTSESIRRELLNLMNEQFSHQEYKLPSEQVLADQLKVSRNTLRPVLSQMAGEGLIFRRHGMGTFLNPEALGVCVNLQEMIDFSSIIERCGKSPSHKIYSFRELKAGKKVSEKLRITPGQKVFRVEYWLYADEMAAIVVEGWMRSDLFPKKPEKKVWESGSAFAIIDQYAGRKVTSDRVRVQSITTDSMNNMLGHTTDLKCESVLLLDSVGFDRNEEAIIWGRAYFDTALIQFDLFRLSRD